MFHVESSKKNVYLKIYLYLTTSELWEDHQQDRVN